MVGRSERTVEFDFKRRKPVLTHDGGHEALLSSCCRLSWNIGSRAPSSSDNTLVMLSTDYHKRDKYARTALLCTSPAIA